MKNYDERTAQVAGRMKKVIRRRRIITSTAISCCVCMLLLVLFFPYSNTPPGLRKYKSSPYFDLMTKINVATYVPPKHDNLFGEVMDEVLSGNLKGDSTAEAVPGAPNATPNEEGPNYVETTDNQVQGVIEADIIKRSTEYAYYLRRGELTVYTIAEENSREVSRYTVYESRKEKNGIYRYANGVEMYLSQDCKTLTVLVNAYQSDMGAHTLLITLDVTDPTRITETNRIYISGAQLSSRLVDGSLLVMSSFRIANNYDFDKAETFLPHIGTPGNMTPVAAEDIVYPEELSNTRYTVVCKLNAQTLQVQASMALLSYSEDLYVSKDHIFATRSFTQKLETDDGYETRAMTEISCIDYTGDKLTHTGSVTVEGTVKNQYSMDEHKGVLRVVTSVNNWKGINQEGQMIMDSRERNASLYCISLEDFKVIASVEKFAPAGEQAESVRFDGDKAYVCTAIVITLTDPVYFFDLSDLSKITWKDTGTIDGYSSSLIQLEGGYLMGIGYGDSRQLKIEIYEQTETGVISTCVYTEDVIFSETYKSYFIDREHNLIGLGVRGYGQTRYILLHFDGYRLNVIADQVVSGNVDSMRSFMDNGWLYIFSSGFDAVKVW